MAHALNIYYEAEHADNPVTVTSPDEVRTLLATVGEKYPQGRAVLLTAVIADDPWGQELSVGIDGDKGVLRYSGDEQFDGVYSRSATPSNPEPITYYYVTADTEFPPNAEVSLSAVRTALIDYLMTGGQLPESVKWQPQADQPSVNGG